MTSCNVVPFCLAVEQNLIDAFDKTLDIKPQYRHIVISSSGPESKSRGTTERKAEHTTPLPVGESRREFLTMISVFFPSKTS
jgi:hypothetical protein